MALAIDSKSIIETSSNAILVTDDHDTPLLWNSLFLEYWGLREDELTNANPKSARELVDACCNQFRSVAESDAIFGGNLTFEYIESPHGKKLQRYSQEMVQDGLAYRIIRWTDVTKPLSLSDKLLEEHKLLLTLVNNVPDQIYFKDLNSRFIRINPALAERYSLDNPNDAIGKSDADFYTKDHAATTRAEEAHIMASGEPVYDQLHHEIWSDGTDSWNLSTKVPLYSSSGDVIGLVGISHDITRLKERENLIWKQANFDNLTNLANRHNFISKLRLQIEQSNPRKDRISLLALDIDHFKEINDNLGHHTGDQVLVEVANRLTNTLRSSDRIARLGSDEFVVLINDSTTIEDCAVLASKILESLLKPILIKDKALTISGSIGIACYPDDSDNADDLLRYVEHALYQAKHLGRNNYVFYTPDLAEDAQRRLILVTSLRKALEENQLSLVYQPIVANNAFELQGVEVLTRWHHPSLGTISPEEFISVAETSGLIAQLDHWVLSNAFNECSELVEIAPDCSISINISPATLRADSQGTIDIPSLIEKLKPHKMKLRIELTESSLLIPSDSLKKLLTFAKSNHINLSIDDFGTGYSALSYLLKYQINSLKIDKVFVDGLPSDHRNLSICRAIIQMAHSLNIDVVAEGVESEAQSKALIGLGCDYQQGFLHHKPMPIKELLKTFRSQAEVV